LIGTWAGLFLDNKVTVFLILLSSWNRVILHWLNI
jgi:hypothetical protein